MQKFKRFHQQLHDARAKAEQSTEVMGILLNMDEEAYIAIERGDAYPDNETLKRLCMMLEWNYYDTQRAIINEISARPDAHTPGGEEAMRALQSMPPEEGTGAGTGDTLGARMRTVREATGQSEDIIAMLLGLSVEHYRLLEAGEPPSDELLRRISMVYDWNYYDLQARLRTEQARALQPRRMGSPFPASSGRMAQFRGLTQEMEALFAGLPERDQQFVVTQLELVRETLRKLRHAS